MEWSWQTVMILIGLLGLAAIIFDGYRKMKRAKAEALGLNVAKTDAPNTEDEADLFNPELPGRARVVKPADPDYTPARKPEWVAKKPTSADTSTNTRLSEPSSETPASEPSFSAERTEPGFSAIDDDITEESAPVMDTSPLIPTARPVNLDEKVPVLLDVEELGSDRPDEIVSSARVVTEHTASKPESLARPQKAPVKAESDTAAAETTVKAEKVSVETDKAPESAPVAEKPQKKHHFVIPEDDDLPAVEDPANIVDPHLEAEVEDMPPEPAIPPVNFASPDAEKLSERPDAEVVLVIHTIARDPEGFDGEKILYMFNSCDLRYGEKNIFHRFEDTDGRGRIQFSVAQMRNPGTFEPEEMPAERYPGLSFFMSLPGARKPLEAYEAMSEMALVIARNLGADVLDGTHSAMTPQTMEHERQQILDYERQQQLAAKKQRR